MKHFIAIMLSLVAATANAEYVGSWKIDDLLTFEVATHAPSTGAATDADTLPTYRIYENETSTPIVTGTMALLDDANTVGFYSEQVSLSAANGFEKGKSYTIKIQGVVDAITGNAIKTFQIEAEVDANRALLGATRASFNVAGTVGEFFNSVFAKLPSDSAKMAGEGAANKNLDDVSGAALSDGDLAALTERVIAAKAFKPNPQLTWVLRRTNDLVGSSQVRRKRAAENVTLYADARPLLGDGEFITPGSITITCSDGTVTIPPLGIELLNSQISFDCSGGTVSTAERTVTFTFATNLQPAIQATAPLLIGP